MANFAFNANPTHYPVSLLCYTLFLIGTRGKANSAQLRGYLRRNSVMLTMFSQVRSLSTYLVENTR